MRNTNAKDNKCQVGTWLQSNKYRSQDPPIFCGLLQKCPKPIVGRWQHIKFKQRKRNAWAGDNLFTLAVIMFKSRKITSMTTSIEMFNNTPTVFWGTVQGVRLLEQKKCKYGKICAMSYSKQQKWAESAPLKMHPPSKCCLCPNKQFGDRTSYFKFMQSQNDVTLFGLNS